MRVYLVFMCSILLACGGGNESNKFIEPKIFDLKNIYSLKPGIVYKSVLESSDPKNTFYQYGRFFIENMPEEILDGVIVTPHVLTFRTMRGLAGSGSIPNGGWDVTYYIETTTGNIISFKKSFYLSNYVLSCKSYSPYHMPATVKSGDSDVTPGFNCENQKMLDSGSWNALLHGNQQLIFTEMSKTTDALGNVKDSSISYILDTEGNIVSVNLEGLSSIPNT